MPVSPARAAAFDILLRVERESSYASELLHSSAYEGLVTADHALATELVMGVMRWRSVLDGEIGQVASQPLAKLDCEILIALRLGLYQLRNLDRIPQRAAIHESVELAKRARKRSAAPFVNAVLRKLATQAPSLQATARGELTCAELARDLSHPAWLVARWANEYGIETARRICEHDQSIPQTAIRLRSAPAEMELHAEGITLAPGYLLASARVVTAGDVTKTTAFRSGAIVIQDEASQLVAALVGNGLQILDCCAAPGGKTLAIADRNPGAAITAVELHSHRARLLQKLLHAHEPGSNPGAKQNIRVVVADVCALPQSALPITAKFERVLADVPCSGTGTLARNPEIKWRLTLDDLAELRERQSAILASAMAQVAPGGRLIYSTCSLEKEENENVIERAMQERNSFRLLDCKAELTRLQHEGELIWRDPASLTRGPYLRTLPGIHPCDGFFAAVLERNPERT
jgi:16S rRNA (cytosine967-C5)-methyltransferase